MLGLKTVRILFLGLVFLVRYLCNVICKNELAGVDPEMFSILINKTCAVFNKLVINTLILKFLHCCSYLGRFSFAAYLFSHFMKIRKALSYWEYFRLHSLLQVNSSFV